MQIVLTHQEIQKVTQSITNKFTAHLTDQLSGQKLSVEDNLKIYSNRHMSRSIRFEPVNLNQVMVNDETHVSLINAKISITAESLQDTPNGLVLWQADSSFGDGGTIILSLPDLDSDSVKQVSAIAATEVRKYFFHPAVQQ